MRQWNKSGFRPPLCTYRLSWARRTSWGRWDDWGDTVLQTQDSKFEPWRSEADHATSRSRRLPTILTFTRGWGRIFFISFKPCSATWIWRISRSLHRYLNTQHCHPRYERVYLPLCYLEDTPFCIQMDNMYPSVWRPLRKWSESHLVVSTRFSS